MPRGMQDKDDDEGGPGCWNDKVQSLWEMDCGLLSKRKWRLKSDRIFWCKTHKESLEEIGSKGWSQSMIETKKTLSMVEEDETPALMKVQLNKVSGGRKGKHRRKRRQVQETTKGRSNLPNCGSLCSGSSKRIVEYNKIKPKYHHIFKTKTNGSSQWRNPVQKRNNANWEKSFNTKDYVCYRTWDIFPLNVLVILQSNSSGLLNNFSYTQKQAIKLWTRHQLNKTLLCPVAPLTGLLGILFCRFPFVLLWFFVMSCARAMHVPLCPPLVLSLCALNAMSSSKPTFS